MLHTVFYDTRNALLSVRVWRVRAEQQQVERPENNARRVLTRSSVEGDVCEHCEQA